MAIINKNSITFNDTKPFNGLAVNAPLVVDKCADGSFAVAAHQIYWGNTYFNGSYLSTGTTQDLLTSIEAACAGINNDQINQIIQDYLDKNGVSIPEEYVTQSEISAMSYITIDDVPTKVSDLNNDAGFITAEQVPEYDATTITHEGDEKQNQTYYISNIDVISLGNHDYKISYTFDKLPSAEIVASNLWENYV